MSRPPPRLADYLRHIIDAIDRIARYTHGLDETQFLRDSLVQDAVIRNLEVIGEASHNLQRRHAEFAAAHPQLPLAAAYQMRNAIAHGYFQVDHALVWNTIHGDLGNLRCAVLQALADTSAN